MDAQRCDRYLPKKPTGRSDAEEDRIETRYPIDPEYKDGIITEPTLIIDIHGKILAWYLPGALSQARQVSIIASYFYLMPYIDPSLPRIFCGVLH